jgi:predicted nuclease of predicted toxin-antitoxin system
MKFLVDEDLPVAVVEMLRTVGHEATHIRAIGLGGKPDRVIFAAAQDRQAVLMSADLGFGNIRAYPLGTHHGIAVLRFPDYFRRSDIVNLAHRFIQSSDLTTLQGALAIITPTSVRIRRSA